MLDMPACVAVTVERFPTGKSTGTCASKLLEFKKLTTGAVSPPMLMVAASPGPVPRFAPVINMGAPGANTGASAMGKSIDVMEGGSTTGLAGAMVT